MAKQIIDFTRTTISLFLGLLLLLFSTGTTTNKIEVIDKDNIRLDLAVISDVHVETNNIGRFKVISKCGKNLKAVSDSADALVLVGDNTMNGKHSENLIFYGMMERVNPIKPYYPAMGNHDVGNVEENEATFKKLRERQISYLQTFVDEEINELYYSEEVNGYHLIFVAPDTSEVHLRKINDEQLDWLEAEVDKAAESGKPIFIFCHHPHWSVESNNERYEKIVTKYDNIFVVVGHTHAYYHCAKIFGEHTTPEIWLPNFTDLDSDGSANEFTGLGGLLEVYDDSVVFRGVNYYTGELIGEDYTFDLK